MAEMSLEVRVFVLFQGCLFTKGLVVGCEHSEIIGGLKREMGGGRGMRFLGHVPGGNLVTVGFGSPLVREPRA